MDANGVLGRSFNESLSALTVTGSVTSSSAATTGTATATADNTVTNVSETILASNASRKAAIIQVVSGGNLRVRLDGGVATASNGTQLTAGGPPLVISTPYIVTGAITGIREGGTDSVVHVTEIV